MGNCRMSTESTCEMRHANVIRQVRCFCYQPLAAVAPGQALRLTSSAAASCNAVNGTREYIMLHKQRCIYNDA
jgi:hypothetical protein